METVTSQIEIDRNLHLLEETRRAGKDAKFFSVYCDLIARGRCFIPYEIDGHLHFAPSRFVGYRHVSFQKHAASNDLDGKITNPAITRVLRVPLIEDTRLDSIFQKFLINYLGYNGAIHKNRRKFWLTAAAVNYAHTSESDELDLENIPETVKQALVNARNGPPLSR